MMAESVMRPRRRGRELRDRVASSSLHSWPALPLVCGRHDRVSRILVIDDEAALGENIQRMLQGAGHHRLCLHGSGQGACRVVGQPADLVFLDMRMPGMSGEEVFARLHAAHSTLPIVFLTAFGSVESAVMAMRNGAFDYLQKPFKREDLLLVANRALAHVKLEREVEELKGRLEALGEADAAQSRSAVMLDQMEKKPARGGDRRHGYDPWRKRNG